MPTFTVTCGDSLEILKQLPDASVDSCVTDPPYGLSEHRPEDVAACLTAWLAGQEYRPKKKGFMGRAWDAWVPGPELWREVYRVLKPGGYLLAMAGSRTQDLMGMAIRLAGFECRDSLDWLYASGFPKSHNISIAIDKQAGSMDHRGKRITVAGYVNDGGEMETGRSMPKHEGITAAAKQWDGWGTALKPARETVLVARKPLDIASLSDSIEAWLSNFDASCAVRLSGSSSAGPARRASVPRPAAHPSATPDDLSDLMDMSAFEWATSIYSNIESSWQNILAVRSELTSMSITGMESNLITDLKTLKSCLLQITQESTIPGRMTIAGSTACAERAVASFAAVASKWSAIRTLSALGCAISPAVPNCLGGAVKSEKEPIIVARKPMEGTVAANVVKYGTGGLNIDGCRVDGAPPKGYPNGPGGKSHHYSSDKRSEEVRPDAWEPSRGGRWPPNVLLSHARGCVQVGTVTVAGDARAGQEGKLGGSRPGGFGDVGAGSGTGKPNGAVYGPTEAPLWACVPGCPIRALDAQTAKLQSAKGAYVRKHGQQQFLGSGLGDGRQDGPNGITDSGGASRFFPILPIDDPTEAPFFYSSKTSPTERNDGLPKGDPNRHPTVKPTALMAWLCRLVTPPGGVVLDPFCGSGSTGRGAAVEGFGFIGVESDPESVRVARLRIAAAARAGG